MISLIAAVAENGVIGRAGALPWRLRDDLKFFKEQTMGKALVMGRKTHESIGRPLPGRENIVLTRDPRARFAGCRTASSVQEALALAGDREVMVIGGAAIYRAFLPLAERIYLTEVKGAFEGDVHFPAWDPAEWTEVTRQSHPAGDGNDAPFDRVVLVRRG
jgi:dihydrofolate reductase